MICNVLTGIPGCGKTLIVLSYIATTPDRYVIAVPRVALIEEFGTHLRALSSLTGTDIDIVPIHSRQAGERAGVGRRLDDALAVGVKAGAHAVVLVTHEALFALDPCRLDGVHVAIDEIPDCAVVGGQFAGLTASYALERHYKVDPLGEGLPWSCLLPRGGAEPIPPSARNAEATELAALLKAASNPNRMTLVDLADWEEARIPRRRVRWWSVWTPMSLQGAASVTLAGAGFERSLLAHACATLHGDALRFELRQVSPAVVRARPEVEIAYFATHRGSTEWWASDDGSRCLVQVSRYLEAIEFDGYWGCNTAIRPYFLHRFGGEACPPRLSGTNSLRQHRTCCFIYSNKAQADDAALLEALSLDRELITRSREHEDIVQFVMRGAIRDATFAGRYKIYVYSQDQAEALRDEFVGGGITDRVELRAVVEAGILDVRRTTAPAETAAVGLVSDQSATPSARRARRLTRDREGAERRRAAARAQREADGTYRPRGRPRTGGEHSTSGMASDKINMTTKLDGLL